MARDDIQVNVRLPADLKRRLDDAAAGNSRSFTAEVVSRLSDSFQDVEQVMLANRQYEAALIDRELDETVWRMTKLAKVVELSHPDYQQAREYYERLARYRELIHGGVQWIERARYPYENDTPAEVHELPTGAKRS